ncbi:MAG: hypothetical protein ACLR1R_10830 [Ruminococcus callidus]
MPRKMLREPAWKMRNSLRRCRQHAEQLAAERTAPDVIVVDPPRKGCDETAIRAMVQMQPERIVMISCNATTAARDCAALRKLGYVVEQVQPVDLFPGTGHVECVVLMSRK